MKPESLAQICDAYGLGTCEAHERDEEGVLNENYTLTTSQGKFFLKGVRDKAKERLPFIAAVELFMREQGIPAVCMLPQPNGERWLDIAGRAYCVYPFIQNTRPLPFIDSDFEGMGALLGRIHTAGSGEVPPLLRSRVFAVQKEAVVVEKLEEYRNALAAKEKPDAIDRTFIEYIDYKRSVIPILTSVTLPNDTLVHGDYHERNLFFGEDRAIIGVCDWEKAELSPRAYEVARSIHYICFETPAGAHEYDNTVAVRHAKTFLAGYRSRYPITDEELRDGFALRLRKLVYSVWIENQHYVQDDARANRFIPHEIQLIKDFAAGMAERILT